MLHFACSLILLFSFFGGNAQRKISEITLNYNLQILRSTPDGKAAGGADTAHTMISIKGPLSRTEMSSSLFSTITLHDARTGTAVALREVSGQKLLIRMSAENWADRNKKYKDLFFTPSGETKLIAGYSCQKAFGVLADGTQVTVFYTPDLVPEYKDYDETFRSINGLPLEWTLTQGTQIIRFQLDRMNMNPVPASRFDIPKKGYRELSYEESKRFANQ